MADASLAPDRFYVYVHSRLSTGEPFYVGKGNGQRAYEYRGRSQYWRRIVAKDGGRYNSFVAKNIDEELAFLIEVELLDKYRRLGVRTTNATLGGEGMSGYKFTPEQRARRSELKRGNKNMLGRKMSEETRARMSAAQRARTHWPTLSEEHKKKVSASLIGNKRSLGKRPSEATRAILSAQRKGKQFTLGHKLTDEHKAKVSAGLKAFYAKRRAEQ